MTTRPPSGTVAHFAVNAVDVPAAQRFYAQVFGWRFHSWGPPGFLKVTTAEGTLPGPIGALQKRRDLVDGAPPVVELTVAVDDVDRACAACQSAGGRVLMPNTVIPGVGQLAFLQDPSGIVIGAMRYESAEAEVLKTDERTALLRQLTAQRAHVLGILEGLSDEALRHPVLPSGWTCLGLVQHLALDVERFWFRAVVAGEKVDLPQGDEGWQVADDVAAAEVLDLYRDETRQADEIVERTPLDAGPSWWPDVFGDLPPRDLRRTILHVLVQTATHAGHLDAVRELIDGRTWLVLTD